MSRMEKIAGELQGMTAAIQQAQTHTAAADGRAREIATRAAGAELTGIASGLHQLSERLKQLNGFLGEIATKVRQATTAAGAVPKEGDPEQTIAASTPVRQALTGMRGMIDGAAGAVDEASRTAGAVLRGGQPGPLLAMLGSVKQALATAGMRAVAAGKEAETGIAEARQLGALGN